MYRAKLLKIVGTALLVGGIFGGAVKASEDSRWWQDVKTQVALCKDEFVFGEPLCIRVRLTNQYTKILRVRNTRGRYFQLTGQDSAARPLKDAGESQVSAWSFYVEVPPGADFNDVVFINRDLLFPGPGDYTVSYDGCVEVEHPTSGDDDANRHAISLSDVVHFKVCEGSAGELEKALREYVGALKSDNRTLRDVGARALTVAQPKLAVKLLRESLVERKGQYAAYTSHAVWALARIGTPEAIQALLEQAVSSDHWMARGDAIQELGRFRVQEALPTLIGLLSDSDARIRVSALRSLGEVGGASATPQVKLKFNDPDPSVRDVARKVYEKLTKAKLSPEKY